MFPFSLRSQSLFGCPFDASRVMNNIVRDAPKNILPRARVRLPVRTTDARICPSILNERLVKITFQRREERLPLGGTHFPIFRFEVYLEPDQHKADAGLLAYCSPLPQKTGKADL